MIRQLPDFSRELVCDGCGVVIETFHATPTGRPRRWCSDACRMRATRADNGPSSARTPRPARTASGRLVGSPGSSTEKTGPAPSDPATE